MVTGPSRRASVWAAVTVLVAGAAVAGGMRWTGRADGADEPAGRAAAVQTVQVVRQDMSSGNPLTGSLGYGSARPVKGAGAGVLTWLPAAGATVKRGQQLYRVDDEPVPLFYGAIPLFRTLDKRNTVGRDVRLVADNLKALGFRIGPQPAVGTTVTRSAPAPVSPPTDASAEPDAAEPTTAEPAAGATPSPVVTRTKVRKGDGVLTTQLIAAIKAWQRDLGMPGTGTVGVGDVVVQSGALRIDQVAAQVGDGVEGELMSVTPTSKVITVRAAMTEAGSVERGDKVTVTLPDDTEAPAEVTAVGTALKAEGDDPDAPPKLTITVTLDDPAKVGRIDAADVQVDFVAETHADVLVVPVGALLALSEGGYAVQLAGGGLVAVETGIFAGGQVEVSADGLAEGAEVVTTS